MKNLKGIILCLLIGAVAYFLGNMLPIVGGPVFGIIIGIIIGLFFKEKKDFASGIGFTSKKILQYAVILLGFGLDLKTVLKVGATSLPVIISTIAVSLIVSYLFYKMFKIDDKIATLIGVGSSICGGSAIAATAPVIEASDDDIAQAISVVFLFNLLAALIFPTFGDMIGFSNDGFALFAGTAVNDTSSVTATASIWDTVHNTGSLVLEQATIVKLTRTLAIIPITLCLAIIRSKTEISDKKSVNIKKILPTFIIYFVLCSFITTISDVMIDSGVFSESLAVMIHSFFKIMKKFSKFFIVMAMTAIGLNTNLPKLIKSGKQSILLGMSCWVCITIISILVQKMLGIF